MKRCGTCRRHLRLEERRCPFCGVSLGALVLAGVLAGCGADPELGGAEGATSIATGDADDTTTSPGGSISATSTSGPAMTTVDPSGADTGPPPSGFIYGMSDGGGGFSFECDLFAQDCNRGEKCMPWANDGGPDHNATRCSPLDPNPAAPGEPCLVEGSGVSGIDNCELGAMCLDVDETNAGVCVAMCTGSAEVPICGDGEYCAQMNSGALSLCLDQCDPLLQNCEAPKGCYPVNDSFACMTPVDAAGLAPGDVCLARGLSGNKYNTIRGCAPGMICIGADAFTTCAGVGCCSPVCDASDPTADPTCAAIDRAQGCENWFIVGNAPPGYENAGVCALPL